MEVNLSATNDDYVTRYPLPGVPNPLLPADIANKEYVMSAVPQSIIPAGSTSVTNSIVPVDTGLRLPVLGDNHAYYVHVYGRLNGGTTAGGIRCGFTCSTTTSVIDFQFSNKNSQPNVISITNNNGNTGSTPLQTGNSPRLEITGLLMTSGVDGHLTFQFAQQVADASTLFLLGTSFMTLTQIF